MRLLKAHQFFLFKIDQKHKRTNLRVYSNFEQLFITIISNKTKKLPEKLWIYQIFLIVPHEIIFVPGIFFSNGEQWASSRKFVVKHMRAYGKNEKENIMTDEINRFVERIRDTKSTQVNISVSIKY